MATSESEDFESADEEFHPEEEKTQSKVLEQDNLIVTATHDLLPVDITSKQDKCLDESDASEKAANLETTNTDYIQQTNIEPVNKDAKPEDKQKENTEKSKDVNKKASTDEHKQYLDETETFEKTDNLTEVTDATKTDCSQEATVEGVNNDVNEKLKDKEETSKNDSKKIFVNKRRQQNQHKESRIGSSKLGAKKLGARVTSPPQDCKEIGIASNEDKVLTQKSHDTCVPDKELDTTPPTEKSTGLLDDSRPTGDLSSVFDKLSTAANRSHKEKETNPQQSSSWGWSGWGSSLLTTATASVSTLTSHVSQGISTVIETVEGGLGAPDPAELARQDMEAAMKIASVKEPLLPEENLGAETLDSTNKETSEGIGQLFPLGQLFSGVSQLGKIVENTSAKVLSGGLDTLEVIGKKTMEVLQEGDPGLKKKRAIFQPDKPILSQVLREAKNQADEIAKLQQEKEAAKRVHFETLFDDFQGLIHLEALEMLSRQCEMKLQASLLELAGSALQETQSRLQSIRDECLLPDPDDMPSEIHDDFEEALTSSFASLPVSIPAERIIKIWNELRSNTKSLSEPEQQENIATEELIVLHEKAISSLAHLTAICVEHFHRIGELLLVNESRQPHTEATQLVQITLLETSMIEQLATQFCEALNTFGEPAQPIITKVFLEASNSSTYIQDAFQLLVPVLQIGIV